MPITRPPGAGQLPWVEIGVINTTGSGVLSANQAVYGLFRVAEPITLTGKFTIGIAVSSGNIDVGVYRSDGTTLTRMLSTGSTASAPSGGAQTFDTATALTLVPKTDYYLAFAVDNVTIAVDRLASAANMNARMNRQRTKSSSFPLPTSLLTSDFNGTSANLYWMMLE